MLGGAHRLETDANQNPVLAFGAQCNTLWVTDARLPWPTPDSRARYWVEKFADMHEIVDLIEIPAGLPERAISVLTTARELIRFSYYRHEFNTVGVATSIMAVEAALSETYGAGSLNDHLKRALEEGTLTAEQADILNTGRQIRNAYSHGKTTHVAMTPALALQMVSASIRLISELTSEQPQVSGTTD
ncbi:hypothetical protein [Streptomyces formicae]|uniref:DUF4145 domain-containing protein n=1 Tax=Streptomyces formicae TaxID=1616117 RepID=A0ABY3WTX2_9ACTN|nr:hypothetical protein [Streptomyces formicae]UNM15011.1 hypothetical protein J4032_29260 [Streptomyces formicae]